MVYTGQFVTRSMAGVEGWGLKVRKKQQHHQQQQQLVLIFAFFSFFTVSAVRRFWQDYESFSK